MARAAAEAAATQADEEPVYRIYNPSVPGAIEAWLPEAASLPANISEEEDHEKVFRSSTISFSVLRTCMPTPKESFIPSILVWSQKCPGRCNVQCQLPQQILPQTNLHNKLRTCQTFLTNS